MASLANRPRRLADPRRIELLTASLLLVSFAASAQAGSLFVESSTGQLGTLNPTTGAYFKIGNTTLANNSVVLGGLGFGPGGALYGVDGAGGLYTVNTSTANLTLIGSTGLPATAFWSFGATSDGALYANWGASLYTVDPTTAKASKLSDLGFYSDGGMNGDASGHLYLVKYANLAGAVTGLATIDRTTGQPANVGGPNTDLNAAFGLAFSDGTMYGINTSGNIYRVNLTDGTTVLSATYDTLKDGYVNAAAASPASVPEPASTAVFAAIGLGAFALLHRRIRQG